MDIQPMHAVLLGSVFCMVIFWLALIVGAVKFFTRRRT
jgi:hypothetical protein